MVAKLVPHQAEHSHIARMSIAAYAETDTLLATLHDFKRHRMLSRSGISIDEGGVDAAIVKLATVQTPDVLMVEGSAETLLQKLQELSPHLSPTNLLVFGDRDSTDLMRDLQGMGVHDYFAPPFSADKIIASITRIKSIYGEERRGQAIAVIGCKGGAGASSLAVEIAVDGSRRLGRKTLLVDLDRSFGTLAYKLGVTPKSETVRNLISSHDLDAAMLDSLAVDVSANLSLLSAQEPVTKTSTSMSPEDVATLVDAARRNYEMVVVDLPSVWNSETISALQHAVDVVVVLTTSLESQFAGKQLLEAVEEIRGSRRGLHVVINQSGKPKLLEPAEGDYELILGHAPIGIIPFEPLAFSEEPSASRQMSSRTQSAIQAVTTSIQPDAVRQPKSAKGIAGLAALRGALSLDRLKRA